MKFVERCRRITGTRIEAFLHGASDPETALPRLVKEMEANVRAAGRAKAKARASVKSAQRRFDEALGRTARLERGVVLALEQGDESLAREILAAQVRAEKELEVRRERLDSAVKALKDAEEAGDMLVHQLGDLKQRKDELLERVRSARMSRKYEERDSIGRSADNILEQVARMESGLDADEEMVRIRKRLAAKTGSIDERLRQLEHESEVEKRLEAMRKPRKRS